MYVFENLNIIKWKRSSDQITILYSNICKKTEYRFYPILYQQWEGKKYWGCDWLCQSIVRRHETSISRHSSNLCSSYSSAILFDFSRRARSLSSCPQLINRQQHIFHLSLVFQYIFIIARVPTEPCMNVPAEIGQLWSITTASLVSPWKWSKVKWPTVYLTIKFFCSIQVT